MVGPVVLPASGLWFGVATLARSGRFSRVRRGREVDWRLETEREVPGLSQFFPFPFSHFPLPYSLPSSGRDLSSSGLGDGWSWSVWPTNMILGRDRVLRNWVRPALRAYWWRRRRVENRPLVPGFPDILIHISPLFITAQSRYVHIYEFDRMAHGQASQDIHFCDRRGWIAR